MSLGRLNNNIFLNNLLKYRDDKSALQRELLSKGPCLVAFTMNIPGTVKNSPVIRFAFRYGCKLIDEKLNSKNIIVKKNIESTYGDQCYWLIDENPISIKKMMIEIEEHDEVCRLFDIDVLNKKEKISRLDLGLEQRKCLLCNNDAVICARSQKHNYLDLIKKVNRLIMALYIKECSHDAMVLEVNTTPKPGLVDLFDSGSHSDMCAETFYKSANVLSKYFSNAYLIGNESLNDDIFPELKKLGEKAEIEMYKSTNGVNTHKGLIFSLGLICASIGILERKNCNWTDDCILSMASNIYKKYLYINISTPNTGGEKFFLKTGDMGVKGEVINGFPTVKNIGIVKLDYYIKKGYSLNDAGCLTLMNIIAACNDTNIFKRCGIEIMNKLTSDVKKLLNNGDITISKIYELNEEWKRNNASPGGSADILAICYFLKLFKEKLYENN